MSGVPTQDSLLLKPRVAMSEAQHPLSDSDKFADMYLGNETDVAMDLEKAMDSWDPQFLTDITHKFKLRRARSLSSLTSFGLLSVSEYGVATNPRTFQYEGATGRINSGGYLAERSATQVPNPRKLDGSRESQAPITSVGEPDTLHSTLNSSHDAVVEISDEDREEKKHEVSKSGYQFVPDSDKICLSSTPEFRQASKTEPAPQEVTYHSPIGYPSPPQSEAGDYDTEEEQPAFGSRPRLPSPPISVTSVIKTIPKPEFPIRVSDCGPPTFSLEAQKRIMRWRQADPCEEWRMPVWLIEPDIECIKEAVKPCLEAVGCESDDFAVEYLTQGSWHKIYTITAYNSNTQQLTDYIFRIALPVDPYYKMESEVATTELVRHSTTIPVPIIYAYDSSTQNKLGLEWMLMEKAAGTRLTETWSTLSDSSKSFLTKRVADWVKQMSTIVSDKIGGIYMQYTETQAEFYIGRCVLQQLYKDTRLLHNVNRGPFESVHDLYEAVLALTERETNHLVERLASEAIQGSETSENLASHQTTDGFPKDLSTEELIYAQADKEDREDFKNWHQVDPDYRLSLFQEGVAQMRSNLRTLCDRAEKPLGNLETILSHFDMSSDNVFVDDTGTPVALMDWEDNPMQPPMFLNQYPQFLESKDVSSIPYRPTKDDMDCFDFDTPEDAEEWVQSQENYYLKRLDQFVTTKLRGEYRKELEHVEPHSFRVLNHEFPTFDMGLHELIMNVAYDAYEITDWLDENLHARKDLIEGEMDQERNQDGDTKKGGHNDMEQLGKSSEVVHEESEKIDDSKEDRACTSGTIQDLDTKNHDSFRLKPFGYSLMEGPDDRSEVTLVGGHDADDSDEENSDKTVAGGDSFDGMQDRKDVEMTYD